jgi:hypothetical protein
MVGVHGAHRANILPEHLDIVQIRVLPVALHDVEEMHERVVFGVREAMPDLHLHRVVLPRVLAGLEYAL